MLVYLAVLVVRNIRTMAHIRDRSGASCAVKRFDALLKRSLCVDALALAVVDAKEQLLRPRDFERKIRHITGQRIERKVRVRMLHVLRAGSSADREIGRRNGVEWECMTAQCGQCKQDGKQQ